MSNIRSGIYISILGKIDPKVRTNEIVLINKAIKGKMLFKKGEIKLNENITGIIDCELKSDFSNFSLASLYNFFYDKNHPIIPDVIVLDLLLWYYHYLHQKIPHKKTLFFP